MGLSLIKNFHLYNKMRESSTYNTKKNTVVTRKHKKEIRLCCYATRRGALPEEASIHTAEMTAMKKKKERS